MFFCEPCANAKDWPGSYVTSYGRCEVCGESADCYDVPSRQLPKPAPVEPVHTDILGQPIHPGAKVLWGGGKTQHAGFAGGPCEVIRSTAKMVRILVRVSANGYRDEKVIHPKDLVVVDRLLKNSP